MSGYRIKTVASMTGVNSELLRAWERRYGVVQPRRSRGGYREYSEQDVEKLRLLRALTARGYTIGELASLTVPDLGDLLDRERERKDTVATPGPRHSVIVDHLVSQTGDPAGFRRALRRTLALLPTAEAVDTVLLPMLAELSDRTDRSERHGAACWLGVEEVRGFIGPLSADVRSDAAVVPICSLAVPPPGLRTLQAQLVCLLEGVQPVSIPPEGAPWELAESLGGAATILCTEADVGVVIDALDAWTSAGSLLVYGPDSLERAVRRRGAGYIGVTGDLPGALRAVVDQRT